MISEVYNEDCMIGMAKFPDKFWDLAVCDPPYGGGQHFNFRYGTGDAVYENNKPDEKYFKELFRVSKNQIIWGANYFTDNLPVNRCWISWYKGQPINSFSDFELAWTSFDQTSRSIRLESYGFNHADTRHSGGGTIHPTQKPISLYRYILDTYASVGDKILDTHLGSGSHRIAAYDLGLDFWGWEIDEKHYNDSVKRFDNHRQQLKLIL